MLLVINICILYTTIDPFTTPYKINAPTTYIIDKIKNTHPPPPPLMWI